MKFAFFVSPHIGGTYTVFIQLRGALAEHGIELIWMGPARRAELADDRSWRPSLDYGVPITPRDASGALAQAREMAGALEAGSFDGVFVNVLSDRVATNLTRHLPADLLRIMIVHNMTPGTYAAAQAIRDHVHATVCVSARARDDLMLSYGFDAGYIRTIENAASPGCIKPERTTLSVAGNLRVLYLGRVEDAPKGVLWLPRILGETCRSTTLTVAGDGPDLDRLRRAFMDVGHSVRLLGEIPSAIVPQTLAEHDALIMPSRFEGMPMALIEAMALGCVPVASRIRGVTDEIVDDRRNGLLFPVGDCRAAARCLGELAANPAWREDLSAAAIEKMRSHYRAERMGAEYASLIKRLRADPPAIAPPIPMSGWRFPRGLRSGLRTFLPTPVKNALRTARART